jgi:type III secretion system low calcium response chaperone LcrH/SycD
MTAAAAAATDPFADFSDDEILDFVKKYLENGKTIRELQGLTRENMEALYNVGYTAYNAGRHADAHNVFKYLCYIDHLTQKYWMAFAGCQQAMKSYQGAIDAYAVAWALDVEDPYPTLRAAECALALGEREAAAGSLEIAIEAAEAKAEHAEALKRAKFLLALTQKELAQAAGASPAGGA